MSGPHAELRAQDGEGPEDSDVGGSTTPTTTPPYPQDFDVDLVAEEFIGAEEERLGRSLTEEERFEITNRIRDGSQNTTVAPRTGDREGDFNKWVDNYRQVHGGDPSQDAIENWREAYETMEDAGSLIEAGYYEPDTGNIVLFDDGQEGGVFGDVETFWHELAHAAYGPNPPIPVEDQSPSQHETTDRLGWGSVTFQTPNPLSPDESGCGNPAMERAKAITRCFEARDEIDNPTTAVTMPVPDGVSDDAYVRCTVLSEFNGSNSLATVDPRVTMPLDEEYVTQQLDGSYDRYSTVTIPIRDP